MFSYRVWWFWAVQHMADNFYGRKSVQWNSWLASVGLDPEAHIVISHHAENLSLSRPRQHMITRSCDHLYMYIFMCDMIIWSCDRLISWSYGGLFMWSSDHMVIWRYALDKQIHVEVRPNQCTVSTPMQRRKDILSRTLPVLDTTPFHRNGVFQPAQQLSCFALRGSTTEEKCCFVCRTDIGSNMQVYRTRDLQWNCSWKDIYVGVVLVVVVVYVKCVFVESIQTSSPQVVVKCRCCFTVWLF